MTEFEKMFLHRLHKLFFIESRWKMWLDIQCGWLSDNAERKEHLGGRRYGHKLKCFVSFYK